MGVIDQYWTGVLQRMQAEVEVFNKLIHHQGERGRENELALARVLEGLVPRRFGIGTGLLIDSHDNYSKQMDILISDQIDAPSTLAQTTQLLHPIEDVAVVIEVKTTLNKTELDDTSKKKQSIASLESKNENRPLFALFSYAAETHSKSVRQNFFDLPSEFRPDLFCLLDPGVLAGHSEVVRPESEERTYDFGLTFLHEKNPETGERVKGEYVTSRSPRLRSQEDYDGRMYPVENHNGGRVLCDPSRALLLFCESLVRSLAMRERGTLPSMTSYLKDPYRDLEAPEMQ